MILWRIGNHPTLDGAGGLRTPGRWHSRGRRVVYCAPNPATALLEVLVHAEIDLEDIPVAFRYLQIEAADSIAVETVRTRQSIIEATREAGDEWLASRRTALLRVPSVIVPATWNLLINPQHPDSTHIRIARTRHHGFDPRLKK